MEENDQILEGCRLLKIYVDRSFDFIKEDNGDTKRAGQLFLAIGHFLIYGKEPELKEKFDFPQRLTWNSLLDYMKKGRALAIGNKRGGKTSKGGGAPIGNKNASKGNNNLTTSQQQVNNKSTTTNKNKKENKNNIKETNVSSCSNEHAAADAGKEEIDFSKFLQYFNDTMKKYNSPKIVSRLTTKRKGLVNARLREYSKEEIKEAIENYAQSDFLQNNKKLDFGWFFRPENFPKVLEGKYNDAGSQKRNKAHGDIDKNVNQIWDKYE